jgi:tetratricopeptide (TPR) repeat protein
MTKKSVLFCLFAAAALLFAYCGSSNTVTDGASDYKFEGAAVQFENIKDSVKYVGAAVCKSCHNSIYETFHETGMGRSFDRATRQKTAAKFDAHSLVYDAALNYYYQPFFKDSVLYIKEFRLQGRDTIHSRTERIAYIIGSGQHTNSHLINTNGYITQAPITFYTQSQKWDLAPGFDKGNNPRFTRLISSECMTCHNHYPKPVAGSENKYSEIPTGIECERCHGPGELHTKSRLAGTRIDTAKGADYTIVNPRKLPIDLQLDLCQRCHLQGTAVLKEGRSWYDFRPGMPLRNITNVFLPRYTNSSERFIMASQADRMRLSKCYTVGKMTCITCHNPHISVKATGNDKFNNACMHCHIKNIENKDITRLAAAKSVCKAPIKDIEAKQGDCVSCHLPKVGSVDIPHVRITDHYIGKPLKTDETAAVAKFLGLQCLTQKSPSPLLMAQGYIAVFDKYIAEARMLDSAGIYLAKANANTTIAAQFVTNIHYHFSRKDYQTLVQYAPQLPLAKINDAWTCYRIGDSYQQLGQPQTALPYLQKAVEKMPLFLEFRNKLGGCYLALKQTKQAKQELEFSLEENPKQPIVLSNLGYVCALSGDAARAMQLYNKALALDPDYEQAVLNKAALWLGSGSNAEAKRLLEQYLQQQPNSKRVKELLQKNSGS